MGFYLFRIFVYYYGFFIALGILTSFFVSLYFCKKFFVNFYDFLIFSSTISLFAIFGSKILYFLVSYKYIDFSKITDINYLSNLMRYGFVFYGGLIGALFGYFFIKKYFYVDKKVFDIFVMIIPLVHSFGRIGCFFTGCCYGIRYNNRLFSKIYTNSKFAPNNVALFPVQLVESFCNFLLFLFLFFYILKVFKNNKKSYSLEIYLFFYSIIRFILEHFRSDFVRGKILYFSTSGFISIVLIFFVIFKILIEKYKNKNFLKN